MTIDTSNERDRKFLSKLHGVVIEHLQDEDFHVKDLVKIMGSSRSQLHRDLKRITGKSITQYIREIRLEEGMKILQNNDKTVSEVAYLVGFGSPSYFNSCFKQYFGIPPGEAKFRSEFASEVSNNGQQSSKMQRYAFIIAGILSVIFMVYAIRSLSIDTGSTRHEENKDTAGKETSEVSIAVLPLNNLSGDENLNYLGDGMSQAVVSKLTELASFDKIVPFQSALRFRDSDMDIPALGDTLGVVYLLEGNFQVLGDRIEIRYNLIEAQKNNTLWAESYSGDWSTDAIFEIQNFIARDILKNFKYDLNEDQVKVMQSGFTKNAKSYDLYLKGLYQFRKLTNRGVMNSIDLYKEAIDLDPEFFETYLALIDSWAICGFVWGMVNEKTALSEIQKIIEQARKLKNLTPSELLKLKRYEDFVYYHFNWDFKRFKPHFYQFMESGEFTDDSAIVNYSRHNGLGVSEVTKAVTEQIQENPNNPYAYRVKAQFLLLQGKKEEALKLLQDHILFFTDNYTFLFESAHLFYCLGDYGNLHNNLEILKRKYRDRAPVIWMLLAVDYDLRGEELPEQRVVDSLTTAYDEERGGSPAWYMALYHMHLKEYDNALDWLERSFNRKEVEMIWLRSEPMLQPLYHHPRYLKLYRQVGFESPPPQNRDYGD